MSGNAYYMPDKEFSNEQAFKTWYMNELRRFYKAVFEVENEEKEPGFPDVLAIDNDDRAHFYEFKVAYKGGRFTFEPTQPRFFKFYPYLDIHVMVWDAEQHAMYCIPAILAANVTLTKCTLTLNVRKI